MLIQHCEQTTTEIHYILIPLLLPYDFGAAKSNQRRAHYLSRRLSTAAPVPVLAVAEPETGTGTGTGTETELGSELER